MKNILTIILIGLISFSCGNFLEEDNKGGIPNEEFYKTAVGYETLITASYSALRDVYGARYSETDVGRRIPWLLLAGTDLYQRTRQPDHMAIYVYSSLFSSDPDVKDFYSTCYKSIQTVNAALYYNDLPTDLSDDKRKEYKAELRFLRAFYHFLLVEQFGGIVINDEYTQAPRTSMPRISLADSYNFIISEIEGSINDLSPNAKARVNQIVANHYLAKIYLTRGWDMGNSADFTKSKEYAQKVITAMGEITLTYKDVWNPTNENNSEIIFAVQYDANSIDNPSSGGNTQQALFGPYMGGSETNQKLMLTQLAPSWSLHSWYDENDARYDETFMLTVYERYFDYYTVSDKESLKIRAHYPRVWGREYTGSDSAVWMQDKNLLPPDLLKIHPYSSDEEFYRSNIQRDFNNPTIKKFDSPQSSNYGTVNNTASVRDIVLARLAETYFVYAEASIGLNDFVTAEQYVQKVLDRPGNAKTGTLSNAITDATTQQDALHGYLIESGKEFAGEYNGRWPELRRTGMLGFMLNNYNYDIKIQSALNLDFNNKYNLRPIPEDAIILNEGLTEADQNPGY